MSQDKELEIQLQFLDEALDYVATLDAALLGLTSHGIDIDKINAALRSAHSIKGGAGMMGFQTLSELAHRLEDSFKVLKIQKHTVQVDSELEHLLLTAVDCLRQVIAWERQCLGVNPSWLESYANPIFAQLHQRLGDPTDEDAQSILSPEEGQDIIPLLFQTEVEGCLQRLETVLATQDPRLREEVEILTQELGGLGEMLQLTAFTQLCESIAQQLKAHPHQTQTVAQQALQAWRQSQSLILANNWQALPNTIPLASPDPSVEVVSAAEAEVLVDIAPELVEPELVEPLVEAEFAEAANYRSEEIPENILNIISNEISESATANEEVVQSPVSSSAQEFTWQSTQANSQPNPQINFQSNYQPNVQSSAEPAVEVMSSATNAAASSAAYERAADFRVPEPPAAEPVDNTVRVSVKQLDQLNDLFSELVIERNGLDLHLRRLRNLVEILRHRVQILEESNSQLRNAYDKVETQTNPFLGREMPKLPASVRPANNSPAEPNHQFDVLEMDRYNSLHLLSQEVMETIVQVQEVTSDIELGLDDAEQTARELNKTSRQLQSKLSQVRMRPLSDITSRFPRALRELSLQYQKPVQLKVQGDALMIDRNILEALNEPLMHLLRNAFDHGIESPELRRQQGKPEQGTIQIRAAHQQNRTVITVSDDGAGIPIEKIRARARQMGLDDVLLAAASDEELLSLIFEPGFSTSDRVTALSGRGVGMDVVRNRLKQIHGEVTVATEAGQGTTFTLLVPFTLSVARVLIAESRGMLLAFPTDAVEEITVVQPDQILSTAGSQAFNWNGTMVQLIHLSQWLTFHRPFQPDSLETSAAISIPTTLLLNQGGQLIGLQVDRCWGEQEVAIRQVEGGLPLPAGFSSCTILGDGRVVPLVSLTEMLHWIATCQRASLDRASLETERLLPQGLPAQLNAAPALPAIPAEHQPTVLIVDDSINVRRFLALTLEKAGYQVAQAKDGQDAIDKLAAGLKVEAVICDIEMPRLDGYEFLARVKSSPVLKEIPVAMLTSRSGEKHRRLAMSLGATAYFSKPYNEQTLLQTLEKMMDLTPA
ncbi:response regulator [Leptolyngbya sp. NK1-12]|uniref:histidine kinase n=1 Tax=Leptolyngbya sp. NK1-12 TaxID=2547451 RepID=A0AA96WA47_9CYAN|nr:response regulator [Leptolyngbya sp. NK1-12]